MLKINIVFILILSFSLSFSQTVDKLRLVYDETNIISKQVGATVSNDGKLVAFAYKNRTIKVVDLLSGKTVIKLSNKQSTIFEIRFNYNGTKLISIGDFNSIVIFDLESGKIIDDFLVNNDITKIAVSKLHNQVAIGQKNSTLVVYDLESKKEILNVKTKKHHISAIDFHPKQNVVAFAKVAISKSLFVNDKNNIEIYNLETGALIKTFGDSKYSSISYSNDGEKLYLVGLKKTNPFVNWITGLFSPKFKYIFQYYNFSDSKKYKVLSKSKTIANLVPTSTFVYNNYFLSSKPGNSFDVVDLNTKDMIYTTKNDGLKMNFNFSEFGVGISKIYPLSDGKSFFINSFDNNICQIYNLEKNSITAYLFSDANDDFVVVGRDGRLDGEQNAIAKLAWSELKSSKRTPIENTFDQFYTPDLLTQILSGAKMEKIKLDIENLTPVPEIKFINPVVGAIDFRGSSTISLTTTEKAFKLEFSSTDKGGGLNEIKVYQNGKLIHTSAEGINQLDQLIKKQVDLELIPGENIIKIIATNKERIESSTSTIVKFDGVSNEPSKLFILAIGINEYEKSSYDLNFAVSDAKGFSDALNVASTELFAEVNVTLILDKDANKINIQKAIEKIKPLIKQGDAFVFYYAGHGAMTIAVENTSSIFYLVPSNVTNFYSNEMLYEKGISTSELQKLSTDISAQKQLFIIDACQSGGAIDALASTRGAVNEKELATLARSTGTYFLTASGSDQLAGEFAALGHGVFTYAILQGISGKADGSNGDSKISVKELSLFLENVVPDLSEQYKGQRQFPESFGYGQDFLLAICNKYVMKEISNSKMGKYSAFTIEELGKMKQEAIEKEDYDKAKEIKMEIEKRK